MQIEVIVHYPEENMTETLRVEMESGETPTEAVQARGDARFEFTVLDVK